MTEKLKPFGAEFLEEIAVSHDYVFGSGNNGSHTNFSTLKTGLDDITDSSNNDPS